MTLRLGVWNAEWARSGSAKGDAVREALQAGSFDIICLTETYEDVLCSNGHIVASEPDYGYPIKPGRRKVILWSRRPWTHADSVGSETLPGGRFVCGVTGSPIGPVRVVGICIPWKDAHVTTGRKNRRPWEDHSRYLQGLASLLHGLSDAESTILTGDFNQRIPLARAPRAVFDALTSALNGFQVATSGVVQPIGRRVIDHVAHGRDLVTTDIRGWPGTRPDGLRMSDHDGMGVELRSRCDRKIDGD